MKLRPLMFILTLLPGHLVIAKKRDFDSVGYQIYERLNVATAKLIVDFSK